MNEKTNSKSDEIVRAGWQDKPRSQEGVTPAGVSVHPKKILVPVDFSDCSHKATHYALAFAQQFQAKLVLLHVVEPMVVPENILMAMPELPEAGGNWVQEAKTRLDQIASEDIPESIPVETHVQVGRPFHEITEAAKEHSVDLIVIATHGYTGLKHVLMGSTAERVVRHAPCPVLIVREKEQDFA
jgi:nucleotide-binding universal stress UspA family protein